jgi:hypothetical protein
MSTNNPPTHGVIQYQVDTQQQFRNPGFDRCQCGPHRHCTPSASISIFTPANNIYLPDLAGIVSGRILTYEGDGTVVAMHPHLYCSCASLQR